MHTYGGMPGWFGPRKWEMTEPCDGYGGPRPHDADFVIAGLHPVGRVHMLEIGVRQRTDDGQLVRVGRLSGQ